MIDSEISVMLWNDGTSTMGDSGIADKQLTSGWLGVDGCLVLASMREKLGLVGLWAAWGKALRERGEREGGTAREHCHTAACIRAGVHIYEYNPSPSVRVVLRTQVTRESPQAEMRK